MQTDAQKAQNLGVTGELEGLCHICGAPAMRGCRTCGGSACEKHLNGEICDKCSQGTQI